MLPMDLDQHAADVAQGLRTDGRVVEKRLGAPIRILHPAQDEAAIAFDAKPVRHVPGRMLGRADRKLL